MPKKATPKERSEKAAKAQGEGSSSPSGTKLPGKGKRAPSAPAAPAPPSPKEKSGGEREATASSGGDGNRTRSLQKPATSGKQAGTGEKRSGTSERKAAVSAATPKVHQETTVFAAEPQRASAAESEHDHRDTAVGAHDQQPPAREQVAVLAYSLWEARGRQGGSPEADWLRAEAELKQLKGRSDR